MVQPRTLKKTDTVSRGQLRKMMATLERMRKKLDEVATGAVDPSKPDELVRWSQAVAKLGQRLNKIRFIKP